MSSRNLMLIVFACLAIEDAFHAEAAPSVGYNELTAVQFPRSIAELVVSDEFERVWREAAAGRVAERFGRDDAGTPPPTRNMVGDYMMSNEFQQAVCKAGSQGMSGMGGMMGNAPPPWSYMGTFIGSEKFAHGTCDMMSQGFLQFGEGVNGLGGSGARADPERAVDEFFRSPYYADATERLRAMFSDVAF